MSRIYDIDASVSLYVVLHTAYMHTSLPRHNRTTASKKQPRICGGRLSGFPAACPLAQSE